MRRFYLIALPTLTLGILISAPHSLMAQQPEMHNLPKSDRYYEKHAVWIEMMEDSTVNYYHAVQAFNLYWQNKAVPSGKDEVLKEEYAEEREQKGFIRRMNRRDRNYDRAMREAYKRFQFWQMEVQPYVQEDGTILSKEDQLKIWEQERKRK